MKNFKEEPSALQEGHSDALIIEVATFGIIGDLFKIVPIISEQLKSVGVGLSEVELCQPWSQSNV